MPNWGQSTNKNPFPRRTLHEDSSSEEEEDDASLLEDILEDSENRRDTGPDEGGEEQDHEPPPRSNRNPFKDIPQTNYGDLIRKRRDTIASRKRQREEESQGGENPDQLGSTTTSTSRRKRPRREDPSPPPLEDLQGGVDEYLEQEKTSRENVKDHLWSGYVNLCGAADDMIGEPSAFPQVIAKDKDIRSCFDLCLESNSFGDVVKNVDPIWLLVGCTAMVMFRCKKAASRRQISPQISSAPREEIPETLPSASESQQQGGQQRRGEFSYDDLFK